MSPRRLMWWRLSSWHVLRYLEKLPTVSLSIRARARARAHTHTHTHTHRNMCPRRPRLLRVKCLPVWYLLVIYLNLSQCSKIWEFAPLKCTGKLLQYECLSKETFKNECLLHSKHSVSITLPTSSMFFSEIINSSSKNHNKHINVG